MLHDGLPALVAVAMLTVAGCTVAPLKQATEPLQPASPSPLPSSAPPSEMGPHVTQYTVVRTGSVIATFTKLSVGGHDVRAFPPALIAQQIALLQQAQR
ncbi:hypothetical protein AB0D29_20815 [Streptomyces sp. NPDC048424]|uniref:hypothetical protein n=1 Tax=Streptomyces sp. NPDC048424 TaxID=3155265 RepID=UPI00342D5FC8